MQKKEKQSHLGTDDSAYSPIGGRTGISTDMKI
jgi:hypothetical protein